MAESVALWLAKTLGTFVLTRGLGSALNSWAKRPRPVGLQFAAPTLAPPTEDHLEWEKASITPPVNVSGATLELRVNGNDPPLDMQWDQRIPRQDLDQGKSYYVPIVVRRTRPGGYNLLSHPSGLVCHIDQNRCYVTSHVMLTSYAPSPPLDPGDYQLHLTIQYGAGLRETHVYRLRVPASLGERLAFYA